jgi:hypothetical protein
MARAMFKGAGLRPKANGDLFTTRQARGAHVVARSCALGALYEGTWGTPRVCGDDVVDTPKILSERYPALNRQVANPASALACPTKEPLETVIVNLNDSQGWSRQRIARWLCDLSQEAP